jgi:hypothetical protein
MNNSQSSATKILFHYTTLDTLFSILNTDTFLLTPGVGSVADDIGNHYYYMSLTRSRLGGYHSKRLNPGGVLLTLDGDKLNQRYKSKAIDYWGEESRKYKNGAYEMEDRLFSNEPIIKNARQYIKDVSILMTIGKIYEGYKISLRSSIMLCKKYGIEHHIYANPNDWLTNNKNKAITFDYSTLFGGKIAKKKYYEPRGQTRSEYDKQQRKLKTKWPTVLDDLVECFNCSDYKAMSHGAKNLALKMERKENNVMADIKEYLNAERKSADRSSIDAFIAILKKNKMSLAEYYEAARIKWTRIIGDGNRQ